ncbi:MAG: hypothetical protein AB3N22_05155 [Ruegeria sp.]
MIVMLPSSPDANFPISDLAKGAVLFCSTTDFQEPMRMTNPLMAEQPTLDKLT